MDQRAVKEIGKYTITKQLLGTGGFGQVYTAYLTEDPTQIYAAKVMSLAKMAKTEKLKELLKSEVKIMKTVQCKNIVRLHDVIQTKHSIYLFIDYCNGGTLSKLMREQQLSEQRVIEILKDIVAGFSVLVPQKVMHRDIKGDNILIHQGVMKIADFGLARLFDYSLNDNTGRSYVGTYSFMCPEILRSQPYTNKCDIWSLGVLTYQMLYKKHPWQYNENPKILAQNILTMKLSFPKEIPCGDELKQLLSRMIVLEEKNRISWPEIFNHPYFKLSSAYQYVESKPINQPSESINELPWANQFDQVILQNKPIVAEFNQNTKELEQYIADQNAQLALMHQKNEAMKKALADEKRKQDEKIRQEQEVQENRIQQLAINNQQQQQRDEQLRIEKQLRERQEKLNLSAKLQAEIMKQQKEHELLQQALRESQNNKAETNESENPQPKSSLPSGPVFDMYQACQGISLEQFTIRAPKSEYIFSQLDQKQQPEQQQIDDYHKYFCFERNIGRFLNFVLHHIIVSQRAKSITLRKDLYYGILFFVSKHQLLHVYRTQSLLLDNKICVKQQSWQRYKGSAQFEEIQTWLEKDIQIVDSQFIDFLQKEKEIIAEQSGNWPVKQMNTKIKQILNTDHHHQIVFYELNREMIIETINALKIMNRNKETLKAIWMLTICLNPYDHFIGIDFKFTEFMQSLENATAEMITQKIQKYL